MTEANSQRQQQVVSTFEVLAANERPEDNWVYMTTKQLVDFALLDEAGLDDAEVLNVGCFHPIDEVRFVHRVRRWTATDLGEATIALAEQRAREQLSDPLFARLDFQVADGTALPFPDASFDVTMSMSTVDHVPEEAARQRFVDEMARVTRSTGRVVLTVPNRWSRGYAKRALYLGDQGQHDFFEYRFSPPELRRMVEHAGLEIVRFTSSSEIPRLAPRLFLVRWPRRPLLTLSNRLMRPLGVRMGVLARKP
jgi:SAM-dependent methyltransferase